jgi:hypothetical protein
MTAVSDWVVTIDYKSSGKKISMQIEKYLES